MPLDAARTCRARAPRGGRPGLLLLAAAGLVACGGATPPVESLPAPELSAEHPVTDATYAEAVRAFGALRVDDPRRPGLRAQLVAYLHGRTGPLLRDGTYEELVRHFARILGLFAPSDYEGGRLPAELRELAQTIVTQGSPRGDEAAVLSAHLVLTALEPATGHAEAYAALAEWGRAARRGLPSPVDRHGRLIAVWEEHARLTPAPEVLQTLVELYVARRNDLLAMAEPAPDLSSRTGTMGFLEAGAARLAVQRTPLDVAAVYLRHGDIASALQRVRVLGSLNEGELEFVSLLEEARSTTGGARDALLELAGLYRRARADVVTGTCALGLRLHADDPRFPLCLAHAAADEESFLDATAWYVAAIRLSPEDQQLYDEALEQLNRLVVRGILAPESADARGIAHEAERILTERLRRWPASTPAVRPEALHMLIAELEFRAGNVDAARAHIEQSLEARQTAEALRKLGEILIRTGEPARAAERYRQALDLTPGAERAGALVRAQILGELGDAFRLAGDAQAARMYEEALGIWDANKQLGFDAARTSVHAQRGKLLFRLGRVTEAVDAFRLAMTSAPEEQSVYATVLSSLVVLPPQPDLARDAFEQAQRQLSLEPEWKVYFALWVSAVAARAGIRPTDEAQAVLAEHATGPTWWSRLARFGAGGLPREELLAEASTAGEEAEAHFYGAISLLGAGRAAEALAELREVLETRMVGYFEFIMAQELLLQTPTTTPDAAATPAAP